MRKSGFATFQYRLVMVMTWNKNFDLEFVASFISIWRPVWDASPKKKMIMEMVREMVRRRGPRILKIMLLERMIFQHISFKPAKLPYDGAGVFTEYMKLFLVTDVARLLDS